MSLRPEGRAPALALAIAFAQVLALCLSAGACPAQTIADYGRAQRALLEATMAQNAARAATIAAATAASSAASAAMPAVTSRPAATSSPPSPPTPEPQVSGVFASPRRTWAEVEVEGRSWWLSAGDLVPGTPWRVASVSADQVVLDQPVPDAGGRRGARRQRRFVLGNGR